jgi:acylpyruvate hydrolase
MKLATVNHRGQSRAARLASGSLVLLDSADVGVLLHEKNWSALAEGDGERIAAADADFLAVVPHPNKIFCLGLNYAAHIRETGRDTPAYPTLFGKFDGALTGAYADLPMPKVSHMLDWEAELAVVIGRGGRAIPAASALEHVAGYTVSSDVTVRDWQRRTGQFLAGKTWEALTPLGPYLVTADELPPGASGLRIRTRVNGEVMQDARTDDLLFDVATIIEYASTVITLLPGDVILTGTPGGVGNARDPKVFLKPGDVLETEIERIGLTRNRIVG